jgi:hypothetical protein
MGMDSVDGMGIMGIGPVDGMGMDPVDDSISDIVLIIGEIVLTDSKLGRTVSDTTE